MANVATFVIILTVSKYFSVIGENVRKTNTSILDELDKDVHFNNGVTYNNDGQAKPTTTNVNDFKIGRNRRSTIKDSDNNFYKPLLDFIKNVREDKPNQIEYCDCKASSDEVIQVCINSFRVPLEYIEPRNYYYGNATFKIGEIVHIACADNPLGVSSLRLYEIDPTTGKTKQVAPAASLQFITEIYVKLQKDISYRIECRILKKHEDGSLQILLKRLTSVSLEPNVSYMNPAQDLGVNFIVNGLILSPICFKQSMNQVINFRYFTYPGEELTVGIAESKQTPATVADCDFLTLGGWTSISNTRTTRRISFEMTSDKHITLQCGISISEPNLNESRKVEMILKFENNRLTEPYVFGLSWSRILTQFRFLTEHYVNFALYNHNEILRLAWVSNNSETKLYDSLNYTFLRKGGKKQWFHSPSAENQVKLNESTSGDTYLVKTNIKQYTKNVHFYYQNFTLANIPPEADINIANNDSRCFLLYDRNSLLNADTKEGIPMASRLFFDRTSVFVNQTPVADTENKNYSIVMPIVITASTVTLVYILATAGVFLVNRCLRVRRARAVRVEPSVIYNCDSHHYETLPCDISTRPPCPLPSEAIEENKPYIHYDTPYEPRPFRFGRRQPTQNNRRSIVK